MTKSVCSVAALEIIVKPGFQQGSFSEDDNNDKENVTFAELLLFCDYHIVFAFYDVGEVRLNKTGMRATELSKWN